MKSKFLRAVSLAATPVATFLVASTPAASATITFDTSPQYTCGAQVTAGLIFNSGFCLGVWPSNPVSSNGTPALIYGFGSMTIDQFGGGSFHLQSFLAGISWYSAASTAEINYLFDLTGGGTSSGSFTIGQGFQNYTFDVDITHAVFSGLADGYVAVDNVVADFTPAPGVPEPASWAMMIGGMGVVGGAMRRRRSVKTNISFG